MSDETELAATETTDADAGDITETVEANSTEPTSTVLTDGDDAPSEGEEIATDERQGAPESYSDFEMPEGFDVDSAALEAATPIFKELNLDQGQAQKLVSVYAEMAGKQAEAMAESHAAQVETWTAETHKAMSQEDIGVAIAGLKRFDTDGEVANVLNSTGLGSHPAVVAFFKRVGESTSEDSFDGKPAGKIDRSIEDKLYGNSGQ